MKVFFKFFALFFAVLAAGCCCQDDGGNFLEGVAVEERPAIKEVLDKASSGDTNAQTYLGVLFYTGTVGRNNGAAFTWFKKASENGSGEADYFLYEMYDKGIHVKQNAETAFKYLQSSASKGFTSARVKLAELYLNGERTEGLDKEELLEWLGTYTEQGNEKARDLLAKFQKDPSADKSEK